MFRVPKKTASATLSEKMCIQLVTGAVPFKGHLCTLFTPERFRVVPSGVYIATLRY